MEIENWITWKTHKPDDRGFDQVEFRHELEFGITERFQAAIYLADWNYHQGMSADPRGFTLSGSALAHPVRHVGQVGDETIHRLLPILILRAQDRGWMGRDRHELGQIGVEGPAA